MPLAVSVISEGSEADCPSGKSATLSTGPQVRPPSVLRRITMFMSRLHFRSPQEGTRSSIAAIRLPSGAVVMAGMR